MKWLLLVKPLNVGLVGYITITKWKNDLTQTCSIDLGSMSVRNKEHRRMFAETKDLDVTISKDVRDSKKKLIVETKEYSILVMW